MTARPLGRVMKPTFPLLTAAAVAALSLAACDDRQARVAAPEPPSLAEMDALTTLPPAEPAQVRWSEPEVGYGYAESAYGLQRTFYDEPPAYGFEYGGYEPMVWRTADHWEMYAEPWDDGYRYYYYEPGAAYPYFVQDDEYGYGFNSTGVLIAVITASGAYLQRDHYDRLAPLAGRYYVRGHQLRDVGVRAPRVRVTEAVWRAKAPKIHQSAQPWLRAAEAEPQWRSWREKRGPKRDLAFEAQGRERDHFDGVDRRREAAPTPGQPAIRERQHERQHERGSERRERQVAAVPAGPARDGHKDRGAERNKHEVAAARAAPPPRQEAPQRVERREDKPHGRPPEVRQAQAAPRPQPAARNAEAHARPVAARGGAPQDRGGPKTHEKPAERAAAAPAQGGKPDHGRGPGKDKGGGKKD